MSNNNYYVVATEHAKDGYGMVTPSAYRREKWTCKIAFEGTFEECQKEKRKLINISKS